MIKILKETDGMKQQIIFMKLYHYDVFRISS